jgi:hypothetical protein
MYWARALAARKLEKDMRWRTFTAEVAESGTAFSASAFNRRQ